MTAPTPTRRVTAVLATAQTAPFNVIWAGDGTGDGRVSAVDYSLVVTHYPKTATSPDWRDPVRMAWRADLNGDERVFVEEFSLVVSFYGTETPVPPSDGR